MAIMKRPLAHLVVAVWCAVYAGCVFTGADTNVSAVASVNATFQVSLHYDFSTNNTDVQRCAGALVADDWIITSASCLCSGNRTTCNDQLNLWRIRFGSNLLNQTAILGVSRIEIHPNWTGIAGDGFDVALFRLNGSARALRSNMAPIALPDSYEWACADQQVGIYGWGVGGLVNQLVLAPALILSDWVILATRELLNHIDDQFDRVLNYWICLLDPNCVSNNIAVQYLDQNIGLCSTDIGAPLVSTSFGQSILLGVASYRFSGDAIIVNPTQLCVDRFVNGTQAPVVFSQVDGLAVRTWIQSLITNVTILTSVCGDGRIGHTEQCDDSNTISGDGCSANCTIEQDWGCSSIWTPSGNVQVVSNGDFCTASICRRATHDSDDDGSSGSIIALIIVLSILGGLLILAFIIFCCIRHRKRRATAEVPVLPVEAAVPMAPMVSIPFSPMMANAPPSTPAQGVVIDTWSSHALPPVIQQEIVSPVQLDIVTPTYGMPISEVLPPIVQREELVEDPRVEQTAMVGPPTWLKE